jgi:ATPase subunit of ABC transporter with duplicated ATPase domains
MNQKARQAKNKARIQRYDELVQQANSDAPERIKSDIVIPTGPRLGDVVVEVTGLSKGYGDRLLIDDLSFRLPPGGIVGVVGANGAGKTTLFRMLLGQEQPDSGTIRVGDTVKITNAEQVREGLDPEKSAWEVISGGQDSIQIGRQTLNTRAYVSAFGFKGKKQQQKVGTLSGGERNRLYLAKVLQAGANLLLLDEPSNDLDVETLRELEEALTTFPGCAVVISHDRWFLDRLATHILAFEGNSHVEWFEGNYQEYEKDKRRRLGEDADQPKRLKYKPLVRK